VVEPRPQRRPAYWCEAGSYAKKKRYAPEAPETPVQKPTPRRRNEQPKTLPQPAVLSLTKAALALPRAVSASTPPLSLPLPEAVYKSWRENNPSSAGLAESDLIARFSDVQHVDPAARAHQDAFLYLDRIVGTQLRWFQTTFSRQFLKKFAAAVGFNKVSLGVVARLAAWGARHAQSGRAR
jgi:hypothetical protein